MDKDQRWSEGRVEAEDGKLDFEESLDDEEVTLLLPRKGAHELDLPGRISEMCRKRRVLSGKTGVIWSLCMGLGRNGTGRDDPQWCLEA